MFNNNRHGHNDKLNVIYHTHTHTTVKSAHVTGICYGHPANKSRVVSNMPRINTIKTIVTNYVNNTRNQDWGKVFFLENQEYVDSWKTHDIRLLLTILANLPVPQH